MFLKGFSTKGFRQHFLKILAGAEQQGFNRGETGRHDLGDLLILQALDVVQDDGGALILRKGIDGCVQGLRTLFFLQSESGVKQFDLVPCRAILCLLLRACSLRTNRKCEFPRRFTFTPAKMVKGGGDSDPVEPGVERGILPKAGNRLMDFHEHVLSGIVRIMGILQIVEADAVDSVLAAFHQRGEGPRQPLFQREE